MSLQQKQEVLDPDDQRYKDNKYFKNQNISTSPKGQIKVFNCGCGPIGCGCISILLLFLGIFSAISYLFTLFF